MSSFDLLFQDKGKLGDPNLMKATKIRPSARIGNPAVLANLVKRFLEQDQPPCTDARCYKNFSQRLAPAIQNVLYDKAACDKNGVLRKLNEALSGTVPVPVTLELDEERIWGKIMSQLDGSAPPPKPKEEKREPAEKREAPEEPSEEAEELPPYTEENVLMEPVSEKREAPEEPEDD